LLFKQNFARLCNGYGSYSFTFDRTFNTVGTFTVTITAIDKNGETDSKKATITVTAGDTYSDISSFSARLLYAPLVSGVQACALATATGATYTQAGAKANASAIDILYFYGATANASFGCPADALTTAYPDLPTWSVRNATQFATTSVAFADVTTAAALQTAFDNGTLSTNGTVGNNDGRIYNLSTNQVVAFKTAAGKAGILKVTEINPGSGTGNFIKIDVKVQK